MRSKKLDPFSVVKHTHIRSYVGGQTEFNSLVWGSAQTTHLH